MHFSNCRITCALSQLDSAAWQYPAAAPLVRVVDHENLGVDEDDNRRSEANVPSCFLVSASRVRVATHSVVLSIYKDCGTLMS